MKTEVLYTLIKITKERSISRLKINKKKGRCPWLYIKETNQYRDNIERHMIKFYGNRLIMTERNYFCNN